MIPTSIDGTDITGATIDGTEVQEITVDGDTVFSAFTEAVAYSNLIAWYPFDSSQYGGANADDVTAILGGSGDDTAYNGTVNGATFQSSGGVTDINAGANSGAFDFDGVDDNITITSLPDWNTMTLWINPDITIDGNSFYGGVLQAPTRDFYTGNATSRISGETIVIADNSGDTGWGGTFASGQWHHWAFVFDGSGWDFYVDAVVQSIVDTNGGGATTSPGTATRVLMSGGGASIDGQLDDVRFYNTDLSQQQIQDIYDNTPHP